jgi:hypothetical protein
MESLNEINGIVERNQWNCSTISMESFRETGGFVCFFWRFSSVFLAFFFSLFGVLFLWKRRCRFVRGAFGRMKGDGPARKEGRRRKANLRRPIHKFSNS